MFRNARWCSICCRLSAHFDCSINKNTTGSTVQEFLYFSEDQWPITLPTLPPAADLEQCQLIAVVTQGNQAGKEIDSKAFSN